MGAVRKGLRQAQIVFCRIVMNRLFRTAVNPGVAVLVTDNPVQLDANGARTSLFEDARTLPFGFQYPQAASEDVINFRSQCHGSDRTC